MPGKWGKRLRGACIVTLVAGCLALPAAAQAGTYTVDTSADGVAVPAGCSLREAINNATSDSSVQGCTRGADTMDPDDTILFSDATIDPVLTVGPVGNPDDNATGDLDVEADPATEGSLTIQGFGPGQTVIDGGTGDGTPFSDRLLNLEDGQLTIEDLTMKEGRTTGTAPGGGIRGGTAVSLSASDFITLDNVVLSGNEAVDDAGGGVHIFGGDLNVLNGSRITGNTSGFIGGGIGGIGGEVNVTGSTISGNTAQTSATQTTTAGGGIHSSGQMTFTNSTVSGNTVADPGDTATSMSGAGISSATNVRLLGSTVSGNSFSGGPHFAAGIASNSAGSDVTLLNSTVAGNTESDPFGSTISGFQINTDVRILQSTVAGNTVAPGGNSIEFPGAGSTITVTGSVLGDPDACPATNVTGVTYSVHPGGGCPLGGGNAITTAPLLGQLASNGGPTQTRALLAGSPAIDLVPPMVCDDDLGAPLTSDQRGASRPFGIGCDAGAFELQATCPDGSEIPPGGCPIPPGVVPVQTATPTPKPAKKCKRKKKRGRAAAAARKKCKKKKRK